MRKLYLSWLLACTGFSALAQITPALTDSTRLTQRVFNLGEVVISGRKAEESATVTSEQLESFNRLDVKEKFLNFISDKFVFYSIYYLHLFRSSIKRK